MAKRNRASETYLVPVDFSRSSDVALRYAVRYAAEIRGARLLLLHVITEAPSNVPFYLREDFYEQVRKESAERIRHLLKKKNLKTREPARIVVSQSTDPAEVIVRQAAQSRVSMIIMGSEDRSGLQRTISGSVAEKTARLARCPVLVVKA